MDVCVKVARLPKLLALASQLAGCDLFERLEKLRNEDTRRFVDQQMDMLRHEHVCVNPGLMRCAGQFQNGFESFLWFWRLKEWKPMKAAERDEVKSLGSLEPRHAVWHGVIVNPLRPTTRSSR